MPVRCKLFTYFFFRLGQASLDLADCYLMTQQIPVEEILIQQIPETGLAEYGLVECGLAKSVLPVCGFS